jgi:hypothetical protein
VSFASLVDSLVQGVVNPLTKSFQASVTHLRWIASDGFGEESYASPVSRVALVDRTVKEYRTGSGKLVQTMAVLTFIDPILPHGATGRTEAVDPRDIFVLDDGATAPIVDIGAFENADSLRPFVTIVTLGKAI